MGAKVLGEPEKRDNQNAQATSVLHRLAWLLDDYHLANQLRLADAA